MITFRSLQDCTWRDMTDIWNKGFEGYIVPLHFDEKKLNTHLTKGDISPKHSYLAYSNEKPVGFILNGFRQMDSKKVAWNGGTGVKKEFRGKGVGKALIQKCLNLFKEERVDIATLEAIELNTPAIRLYEKFGYSITDNLYFYTAKNVSNLPPASGNYKFIHTSNKAVRKLTIWNKWTPWQNQITDFPDDGRAVIMLDLNKTPIGYALYREIFDDDGDKVQTILHHCEIMSQIPNKKYITEQLLAQVFHLPCHTDKNYFCSTYNLLANTQLQSVLQEWGFTKQTGQVWMRLNLTEK